MKKIAVLVLFSVMLVGAHAQYTTIADLKFNSIPAGWTITPSGGWSLDNNLYASSPSSIWGYVPNSMGDSVVLMSPYYDFRNFAYVYLRFNHICKVVSSDICMVYTQAMHAGAQWAAIPTSCYKGSDNMAYRNVRFSQDSYSDWLPNDSLATPTNAWWKTEPFDISTEVSYAQVRFKFVIKRGNVQATQFAYGWLLDNFELMASMNEIKPPTVEFTHMLSDTVYNTGHFDITAKIASRTIAPLVKPIYLNVKYVFNSVTTYDTLPMKMVAGDTIWSAVIPQKSYGTRVSYDVFVIDSVGNKGSAVSTFYIKRIVEGDFTGYVTIGNNTLTTYYNILYYASYSWSRQLYLASEINSSKAGGLITTIAFRPNASVNISNQKCYFKAVNDTSMVTNNYIDPETDGSTKVWNGTYNLVSNNWSEIILSKPFVLPAGKHLMVYWINNNSSLGTAIQWSATSTTPTNRAIYKYQAGSFPTTAGTPTYSRPDVRFYLEGYLSDSNSVALYGIENPTDSVVAAPSHQAPVVVTVKNKGMGNLDSCLINWTVNGIAQPTYVWHGHLLDGFTLQQRIGYYIPSVNQYDTIVAWASYPNGVYDSTTNDDTLQKIAFGVTGLDMHFIANYGDTVFTTGPFYIAAKITSRTLQTVSQPVLLNIRAMFSGTPSYDTLTMNYTGNDIYACTTPQYLMGSQVYLSITVRDSLGNDVAIYKDFYLKRGVVLNFDSITVNQPSDGGWAAPFPTTSAMCWFKMVYSPYFLGNQTDSVLINGLSWYGGTNSTYSTLSVRANQRVYFKVVSDTVISTATYEDPETNGYTLVWSGGITTPGTPNNWFGINSSNNLFYLPPGQSLLIYMLDSTGVVTPGNNFMFGFGYSPNNTSTSVGTASTMLTTFASMNGAFYPYRPHIRLYLTKTKSDSNAVGLYSLDSPLPPSALVNPAGYPVRVTLRNKGGNNLTSCQIAWSLNGINQGTTNWAGNLVEEFNDTITIGRYYPLPNVTDNIVVWVKNPNGTIDPTPNDDTIKVTIYGKAGIEANFIEPLVDDTVFYNGPFNIYAKIATRTSTALTTPVLKYNWIHQSISHNDSIVMTSLSGDSIWFASIPKNTFGVTINYSVSVKDSMGNFIVISSYCYLQRGASDKISDTAIIGKQLTSGAYALPFDARYGYSWSRSMFLSSEVGNTTDTLTVVKIAWKPFYAMVVTRTDQVMYMKAVDSSITTLDPANSKFNPGKDGATLVWYGGMTTDGTLDWQEITLLYPFPIPTGKNMIMYFMDSSGTVSGTYPWYTVDATNMAMLSSDAILTPSRQVGSMMSFRSYNRLCLGEMSNDQHAVGMYAIDSPQDTIVMTPGLLLPVKVTIENKGISNLDSCIINWSLNRVMQPSTHWYGNLSEKYTDTITIGYYTPTSGNTDEIVVWTTMPNGYHDTLSTYDDTLKVSSFAKTELMLSFTSPYVRDTIFGVGPFQINAIAKSLTIMPLGVLKLNCSYTYNNVTTNDTVLMTNVIDSLFLATIPAMQYGTHVTYSITLIDSIGNRVTISDWYVTQRGNIVIVGTGTSTSYMLPINMYYNFSWTRQLYMANELSPTSAGGLIKKLAWEYAHATPYVYTNQTCYFEVVDASVTSISSNAYVDPVISGATQVWAGKAYLSQGWVEFVLDVPFSLPPGKNLLIHWHHQDGTSLGAAFTFYYTPTVNNTAIYSSSDVGFPSGNSGTLTVNRPNAQFYILPRGNSDTNSVALETVINPKDTIQAYQNTPIQVVIKNVGIKDLTSCKIDWKINGVAQPAYSWTGLLHQDFIDTVALGYFTPLQSSPYNFKCIVSMPNGVVDTKTKDDTLTWSSYADFSGMNLQMQKFINPVDDGSEVCFADLTAVKVRVGNVGSNAIIFNTDSMTISYKVNGVASYQNTVVINSGVLGVGGHIDILLDSNINISILGIYHFEAHLSCAIDAIKVDDTIRFDYEVKKIILPYDEDFSTLPTNITIKQISGITAWEHNTFSALSPQFGTGVLYISAASEIGAISSAAIDAINLVGSVNPKLEFWFKHDASNMSTQDKIVVKVSVDGKLTYDTLQTIKRYHSTKLGWEKYQIDISHLASFPCVVFAFDAFTDGGGAMMIDRIVINSSMEISIATKMPETDSLVACELDHQTIKAIINNNTSIPIDFSKVSATLKVEVTGAVTQNYTKTLTGVLGSLSSMEIVVDNDFDFTAAGTYNFKMYVTNIDNNPYNDTVRKSIVISPDVSIVSMNSIGEKAIGQKVYPRILLRNTGNLKVDEIPLRILLNGANYITEIARVELSAGADIYYTFKTPYIVPVGTTYELSIIAELSCDYIRGNDTVCASCIVGKPALKVVDVIRPHSTICDTGLTLMYPQIAINNTGANEIDVVVYLLIDTGSVNYASIADTIASVAAGNTNYNFKSSYLVPNLETNATYSVTAYIYSSIHAFSKNACVIHNEVSINDVSSNSWKLGQNIPNPAMASTLIPYSIPKDGKITFKVMTISGQVLYLENIQAASGSHYVELNTETIANGIYYYSMEYKGERIIKKMTIQK